MADYANRIFFYVIISNSQTKKDNMIKTIIFDLGGVLIDIEFSKTTEKFKKLIEAQKKEIPSIGEIWEINRNYEVGDFDDAMFRSLYQLHLGFSIPDEIFDDAWNALLRNFNLAGFNLIKKLKPKYQICLLSNTNRIHYNHCDNRLKEENISNGFSELFNPIFLSYELKMKKPDKPIYTYVVDTLGVNPEEILFIDDLKANIETAKEIGINTIHLTDNKVIEELVLSYL